MKTNSYQCVNCCQTFELQQDYIVHYKSENHRYNVKRKLIGLPPLSHSEYILQFQPDESSKQSSVQELYCEICSKKFMSAGTYKQHISSKKHKQNRQKMKTTNIALSRQSSDSGYSFIGAEKARDCLFCQKNFTKQHMKTQHCFPPFSNECQNYDGLVEYCRALVKEGQCLYCDQNFSCEESVKQHMNDVGHGKLNIHNFNKFEKYYLWKIQESSSDSEQQIVNQKQDSVFEELTNPTLQEIEQKRLGRIQYTNIGVKINGKEVGYRKFKDYYKQHLGRTIENKREKYQPALQNFVKPKQKIPRVVHYIKHHQ